MSPRFARTLSWLLLALGVGTSAYPALNSAIGENHQEDLWIYSSGAYLGLAQQSPYVTESIRERVRQQYPAEQLFIDNCGFFLAPHAVLVYAPALILPWNATKIVWILGLIAVGATSGWYLLKAWSEQPVPAWVPGAVAFAVLCNTMSQFSLILGQSSLLFLGCVVLGQVAQRRGRPLLGQLLWAVAFFKPHLAMPLLLLAWYCDGWRRTVGILVWLGILTLVSCAVTGRVWLWWEYLEYVGGNHQTVHWNRITENRFISSWNRLLYGMGGPAIHLGAVTTLAGYAIWFGMCAARCGMGKVRPSVEWVAATVGVGIPLCCQALSYETTIVFIALAWAVEMIRRGERLTPAIFLVLSAVLFAGDLDIYETLEKSTGSQWGYQLIRSHHSLLVALLALTVWARPQNKQV